MDPLALDGDEAEGFASNLIIMGASIFHRDKGQSSLSKLRFCWAIGLLGGLPPFPPPLHWTGCGLPPLQILASNAPTRFRQFPN